MSDLDDLLGAVVGKHRCKLVIEDGQLGAVCICGWVFRSTHADTVVGRLVDQVVLAALVHTDPRPAESDARTDA